VGCRLRYPDDGLLLVIHVRQRNRQGVEYTEESRDVESLVNSIVWDLLLVNGEWMKNQSSSFPLRSPQTSSHISAVPASVRLILTEPWLRSLKGCVWLGCGWCAQDMGIIRYVPLNLSPFTLLSLHHFTPHATLQPRNVLSFLTLVTLSAAPKLLLSSMRRHSSNGHLR
jgi:hypothetical protein